MRMQHLVEETDARYWVFDVGGERRGDSEYFAALIHQIENGLQSGRCGICNFLIDLSGSTLIIRESGVKTTLLRN